MSDLPLNAEQLKAEMERLVARSVAPVVMTVVFGEKEGPAGVTLMKGSGMSPARAGMMIAAGVNRLVQLSESLAKSLHDPGAADEVRSGFRAYLDQCGPDSDDVVDGISFVRVRPKREEHGE